MVFRVPLLVLIAACMTFVSCRKDKKDTPQPVIEEKTTALGYWQMQNVSLTNGPAGMSYKDIIQIKNDGTYAVYREKVEIGSGTYTITKQDITIVLRFTSRQNEHFGLTVGDTGMNWLPVYPYGAFIYVLHRKNGL